MEHNTTMLQGNGALMSLWIKVPLWLRSLILGFTISTVGIGIWVILVMMVPLPWSVPLMGVILILYWKYFSGSWWPRSTKEFRQASFRQTKLTYGTIKWGSMAGILLFIFLNAGLALTFRFTQFHPETFKTATYLDTLPAYYAWPVLIMASLVAGICEEIGYRGYLQAPLEKRYGPVTAIIATSLIFVVIHLHQAWAGGILIQIFIVSVMIGYLAYASGSLIPGIVAHIAFDVVNFSYWWSNLAGNFGYQPIRVSGIDTHFIITLLTVVGSGVLYVLVIAKLISLKKHGNNL